ncbi:ABC transporter permease [Actinopolymorpha sp. B17G11]|uniref:ABC transporter permease n=1 Tax=Actinopolymorpha sp. B17G11 TaxID=3160861 RepID=UPI0032E44E53
MADDPAGPISTAAAERPGRPDRPRLAGGLGSPVTRAVAITAGALLGWQFIGAPVFEFLPAPSEIVQVLVDRAASLWSATVSTGSVAVLGFVIGCTLAIILALMSLVHPSVEHAVLRLGLALYAVPLIVVAPIFVLWLGVGSARPRVALSALAVFFGVLVNAVRGLRAVDRNRVEFLRVVSASPLQTLRYLRVPSALPYLINGFKVAAPAAVFGAVVGEWVGANEGLGVVLLYSLFQYQVDILWTAMILTTVVALAGYGIFGLAEKVLIPWHESVKTSRLES